MAARITPTIGSALAAAGLTAEVSQVLAAAGISPRGPPGRPSGHLPR